MHHQRGIRQVWAKERPSSSNYVGCGEMAANNYFGFTHGTTQYAAAAGTPAYQTPQAGYAVAQTAAAAAAASYNTQRAATGYDTYQATAHTTPATYAVTAGSGAAAAAQGAYDYSGYARTAPATAAAYDTTKTYYQQAAPTSQPYASTEYQNQAAAAAAAAATSYPYGAAAVATTGTNFNGNTASYTNSTAGSTYPGAGGGGGGPQQYSAQQQGQPQPPNSAVNQPSKPKPPVYGGTVYMNQGKGGTTWQGYKKPGGGAGGAGVKQMRAKPLPKPQQLHYCEVCKISCAGPQTYREHLEGQRHKKKEALQKEGGGGSSSGAGGRGNNNLRCELCDVVCTGTDAYAAHLRGAKHQKVVKLHTRLGKPIPEVDMKTAKAAAAAATTPSSANQSGKITFIQSGTLGSVKAEKEDMKDDNTLVGQADIEMTSSSEHEITPVGQEYIEEIKNDEGKLISFNCKLCECKFNDPNAKDMHMKGRRHRLQFKKKVNPDLVVDVKPSGRRGRLQDDKMKRRDDFLRRTSDESFWTDRLVGEDRMYWEERRRYEEELEYMEWMRRRGPAPAPPAPPPNFIPPYAAGVRRPETIDDRHLLAKHQAICPKEERLQLFHKLVSRVEKALKQTAESLVLPTSNKAQDNTAKKDVKDSEKKDDSKTEDAKTDSKVGSDESGGGGRLVRGVMRVGNFAKGLLLSEDTTAQLVLLCSEVPTRTLLRSIATSFTNNLKNQSGEEACTVNVSEDEGSLTINGGSGESKLQVVVSVTSPVVRELLLQSTADPPEAVGLQNEESLDQAKCLEALAQLRRAKWFQARPGNNPSSVMVIRILRDLCNRNPTWAPLTEWARELLVDRVVGCVGFTGSEALRKVLEAIAGGVLLPGSPGIADPCERDVTDAAVQLTPQQRTDITASAQHALRLFAFRQIHKVLGMAQLVGQGRGPGGRLPLQARFNRKRRRDHSAGENIDSEAGDGKKDKKDAEGDTVMETPNK